ncbi:MAG: PEP-CTERM sorting domain-containing protein [Bryobacteraceae bacterium]|jgi:hypothetical protein
MNLFTKTALSGLLWLTFSGAMFGDTLFLSQSYNVDDGGQFTGTDNGNPVTVYCVDFQNYLVSPSQVNVSTLSDLSDTRYGTTPTSEFTFFNGSSSSDTLYTGPGTAPALDAEQRYLLAAYLTTQYELIPSPSTAVVNANDSIQGAIWDLLDVSGVNQTVGGAESADITQAINWLNTDLAAVAALTSEVVIYTSTNVASNNDLNPTATSGTRYTVGSQEMVGVVPEPQTLAMLGAGLLAIGLFRKHRKN